MCAGAVSQESVRFSFTCASLNEAYVTNAHLQITMSEKHCVACGTDFGLEHLGNRATIRRELHGSKASGHDFNNNMRSCVSHFNVKPCLEDPDV